MISPGSAQAAYELATGFYYMSCFGNSRRLYYDRLDSYSDFGPGHLVVAPAQKHWAFPQIQALANSICTKPGPAPIPGESPEALMKSFLFAGFALAFASSGCRTTSPSVAEVKEGSIAASTPAPQIERFQVWLRVLSKTIAENATAAKAAKDLVKGDNRIAAFNLQALGRLYANDDPMFAAWRKSFKDLEDKIGSVDKWTSILAKAEQQNAAAAAITKLKKKRDEARTELETLLVDGRYYPTDGGTPFLDDVLAKLTAFPWKDYEADKADRFAVLREELDELETTAWDLSHLEEGKGIHELRRRLRWFLIEARVLNGLVLLAPLDSACPSPDFAALPTSSIAASKYGKLPAAPSETNPTRITPCLFLAMAQAVGVIGELKDESEVQNNAGAGEATDTVAPAAQATVEALLAKLKANGAFTTLSQELTP